MADSPAGSFGCTCGKIRVDVANPSSSNIVKPTAALCQCNDCYNFASAVAKFRKENLPNSSDKGDALTASNAVDMRQIYKSDALKLQGAEYLRGVKLKEDSPCVRYYSACCGTPLMMDYKMAPFYLVYQHIIAKVEGGDVAASFRKIPAPVSLFHKFAQPDSAPLPEGVAVRDGVSIGFVSHAILRAIFGMLSGKKTSAIAAQLENVPISVGIESIGKKDEEGN